MKPVITLLDKIGLGRISGGDYRANMNGLNMFFGAVLGFVLAGTETLTDRQFGVVLVSLATVVITIQYVSSSKNRIGYAVLAAVYATAFPEIMDLVLGSKGLVPAKIRPTLMVWAAMAILVEFWPRHPEPPSPANPGTAS